MKTIENDLPASKLVKDQKIDKGPLFYTEHGKRYRITAHIRYDDQFVNGHNSFSITADISEGGRWSASGCCHEEVAKHFPELAPFIKWHLFDASGPMHYIANTVYHAGDKDYHGCKAGEPLAFDLAVKFNGFPMLWRGDQKFIKWLKEGHDVTDGEVIAIYHDDKTMKFGPKYTIGHYTAEKWHDCPFDTEAEALEFIASARLGYTIKSIATQWGEGKERDLDAARSCAVWPDATDEDLTAPGLEKRLVDRLPALILEFKTAMETLGFIY